MEVKPPSPSPIDNKEQSSDKYDLSKGWLKNDASLFMLCLRAW